MLDEDTKIRLRAIVEDHLTKELFYGTTVQRAPEPPPPALTAERLREMVGEFMPPEREEVYSWRLTDADAAARFLEEALQFLEARRRAQYTPYDEDEDEE